METSPKKNITFTVLRAVRDAGYFEVQSFEVTQMYVQRGTVVCHFFYSFLGNDIPKFAIFDPPKSFLSSCEESPIYRGRYIKGPGRFS